MKIGKLDFNPKDVELKHWQKFRIEPIGGKDAVETMRRGCEVLAKTGINYWISSGNLLGIYRDGKLIEHDTDIDVNVLVRWDSLEANILSKQVLLGLTANDFVVIRTIVYKNHFMQLAFMDNKTEVIFDVCFFYSGIAPQVATHLNVGGYIYKPLRFIKEPQIITFKGVEYPIPNHVEEFLIWRYGENWKIPKDSKEPWENEDPAFKRYK
jgi:phosphorylcholine metabolism protein LicD